MNVFSRFGWIALAISFAPVAVAYDGPCVECNEPQCLVADTRPSWIFSRSTYTHDPETGARVAQYMRIPPVEPLQDERMFTSRYRRSRTNLRGADGSSDTYYEVQSWGNGRGGIDAEWERFHDAWKESYLQGGYYNGPGYGGGYPGQYGYGGYGGQGCGNGYPGYGFPGGGFGGPGNWGPGPWQNNGGHGHPGNDGHGDDHDNHGHGGGNGHGGDED